MKTQTNHRQAKTLTLIVLFFVSTFLWAQNDSIRLRNNDLIVGEIKTLSKSVLTFKTSYSENDFKIDFDDVVSINTNELFVIHLIDREQITGNMKPISKDSVRIIDQEGRYFDMGIRKIIQLEGVDEKFWSRFSGALDIGLNLAKANNNRQLTISGFLGYASETWNTKFDYNTLYTNQDNTERIERKTMSLVAQRYIKEWYVFSSVSYLQSSEQGIKNRITPTMGSGRYLIVTPKLFWIAGIGISYNIEDFVDSELNKQSTELQLLTQFDMFNFDDISLSTKVVGYPSLSEKRRFRADYNFVLKYDLPLDFYIKAEFTLNYDNQPAIEGNFTDYVFSSGFGWEL
jgi:hypothetical protein